MRRLLRLSSSLSQRRSFSSSLEAKCYDVVIVGGGMVGAALSCSLGREPLLADKRILVLEASRKEPRMLSRADPYGSRVVNINIGSVQLLKELDVWSEISSVRARAFNHIQVWDACADSKVSFDPVDEEVAIGYIVENDLIVAALNKRARSHDNVEVQRGRSVVGIQEHHHPSDWRSLVLDDGSQINTRLVAAADGGRSVLRDMAGMSTVNVSSLLGPSDDQHAIIARLKLEDQGGSNTTAWQRFLPSGPIALLPLTDDTSSLVWSAGVSEAKRLMELSDEEFTLAVKAAFQDHYPRSTWIDYATAGMDALVTGLHAKDRVVFEVPPRVMGVHGDSRVIYPLSRKHSPRYVQHRLALIGDAAHTVHPLAGLGVNLGFGDVVELTNSLKAAVSIGNDVGHWSHLLHYETARQRHIIPVMGFIEVTRHFYSTSHLVPVALRAGIAKMVQSIKPLKDMLTHQAEKIA